MHFKAKINCSGMTVRTFQAAQVAGPGLKPVMAHNVSVSAYEMAQDTNINLHSSTESLQTFLANGLIH